MIGLGASIEFTYLGIICAFLLLCFETFLVLSIQQIGVGYATGLSVFSMSVVSPMVQIILGQPIESLGIMVLGLVMLALSVFLMSILRDVLQFLRLKTSPSVELAKSGHSAPVHTEITKDTCPGMYQNPRESIPSDEHTPLVSADAAMEISRCQMMLGLIFSSLTGGFMSGLHLPSLYATTGSAGASFFFSFAVAIFVD